MTVLSPFMKNYFLVLFLVLAVLVLASLLYGVFSRRFTDKIVAANMVSSLTLSVVVLLALYLGEDYILDVGLVYALLSFLAVAVLCRVVTDHIIGKMRHMRDARSGEEPTKREISDAGAYDSATADRYEAAAARRDEKRRRRKGEAAGKAEKPDSDGNTEKPAPDAKTASDPKPEQKGDARHDS